MEHEKLKIPPTLTGRPDVNRLLREVQKIDDFFLGANARKSGSAGPAPPRVTRLLSTVAQENRLNLLQDKDRDFLTRQLKMIIEQAPNVHISFAAEPSPKVLEKILGWFRENIHPQTMIVVGLQPSIAAGITVRTPNKVFDLSMQSHLKKQEDYLTKLINEVARG